MDFKKLLNIRNESGNDFGTEIGARIIEIGEGYAYGELTLNPFHKNIIGTVQAGVIFTFADVVGGSATMAYGNYATTVNSTINFLNAASENTKMLIGRSKVVKNGKNIMVSEIEISDEKGTMIATATFTFFKLKKKILENE